MDPEVAIKEIQDNLTDLQTETDRSAALRRIEAIIFHSEDLRNWFERGGFLPSEGKTDYAAKVEALNIGVSRTETGIRFEA